MATKQIKSGSKAVTTAGTRVRLVAAKLLARNVRVTAKSGNSGIVYLGDVTVAAANGYAMAAGASVLFSDLLLDKDAVVDLNNIYLDSATNGDGVSFLYFDDVAS